MIGLWKFVSMCDSCNHIPFWPSLIWNSSCEEINKLWPWYTRIFRLKMLRFKSERSTSSAWPQHSKLDVLCNWLPLFCQVIWKVFRHLKSITKCYSSWVIVRARKVLKQRFSVTENETSTSWAKFIIEVNFGTTSFSATAHQTNVCQLGPKGIDITNEFQKRYLQHFQT